MTVVSVVVVSLSYVCPLISDANRQNSLPFSHSDPQKMSATVDRCNVAKKETLFVNMVCTTNCCPHVDGITLWEGGGGGVEHHGVGTDGPPHGVHIAGKGLRVHGHLHHLHS